jgi:signal transduction histidine kinase
MTQTARRHWVARTGSWLTERYRHPWQAVRRPMSPETGRVLLFVIAVALSALGLVAVALSELAADPPTASESLGALALLGSAIVAEAFPVPIEGVSAGRTSLATVFIVSAAVIYDWRLAVLSGFLTMTTIELGRRRARIRVAFNTGVYTLAAGAAGATAAALPGGGLLVRCLTALFTSSAFYLVNIGLLGTLIARFESKPLLHTLRGSLLSTTVPFAIMASLTVILVALWDRSPFLAVALVGPLVSIALYQRRQHGTLDRLRELDRLKDEFIAVTSHELRTPLASVYGAAMTLQRQELDPEQRESMLGVIYRESARLARLVDQVLWASRLESGRVTTTIESCDPVELVEEVVEAEQTHMPAGLSLTVAADEPPPRVAADGEKVKQVLTNLIDNAVKYSTEGGGIEISLQAANDLVRFSVRDDGLGIPLVEQQRIFDKFHRLDPNMTRGVGGTGLGLYICRELIDQMNGRIWVTSREGEGSTFAFELPVAQSQT